MFEAYHGMTAPQHQANFDKLSARGYRMISLSVYGEVSDARYAAVWVLRAGPAWVAVHGLDAAGYQAFFDTWTAKGFAPVLVSATGAFSNAIFAAVFEQGTAGPWLARHGMPSGPAANAGTFENLNQMAANQRMILRSVAIYGTPNDRRYAAIWHYNPGYVKWHVHAADPATVERSNGLSAQLSPGARHARRSRHDNRLRRPAGYIRVRRTRCAYRWNHTHWWWAAKFRPVRYKSL